MNKYIVLSAAALVISITFGCQNCGYKTAHSSRYETLVGKTRLESPKTNCRYNTCTANNTCNPCSPCNTQLLANNGQLPYASTSTACYNPTQDGYQNGLYEPNTTTAGSTVNSLLQEAPQPQVAQEQPPLHWRRVTENEQQYANAPANSASVGVASALNAPAFGSPAPASAPGVAPQYPRQYPNQYGNSSPRVAAGVESALTPGYPSSNAAPQYPGQHPGQYAGQYPNQYRNSSPRVAAGVESALTPEYPASDAAAQYAGQYAGRYPNQYPNSSRRATAGVDSAVSVPNYPLPRQYANQYPSYSPRIASGSNSSYNAPSYGAPSSGTDADQLRWRHVTEEEQYYNSSRGSAYSGSVPTADNSAYAMPAPPSVDSSSQSVPVYQSDNQGVAQPQDYSTVPGIDPNVLPMPESPTGTF